MRDNWVHYIHLTPGLSRCPAALQNLPEGKKVLLEYSGTNSTSSDIPSESKTVWFLPYSKMSVFLSSSMLCLLVIIFIWKLSYGLLLYYKLCWRKFTGAMHKSQRLLVMNYSDFFWNFFLYHKNIPKTILQYLLL